MSRLKTLVEQRHGVDPLRGGHALCQGCGIPMVVRVVLGTITRPTVVVNATGCLEVATTRFPTTAWNVPWVHVAFENAAAVASGIEAAQRALARRHSLPSTEDVAIVVFAGDGGTYDIGMQALSGALERGHRFLFVCYDNEAYMNTGVQRSGATPFAAGTTTSPVGLESFGKAQKRKDMTAIAVAHHVPYVAQAASTYWHDLSLKVERAAAADGAAFVNVLTDCPVGWGHEPRLAPHVIGAAVETRFWPLYEVVDGRYRLTYEPLHPLPIERWLEGQQRFAHLLRPENAGVVELIQANRRPRLGRAPLALPRRRREGSIVMTFVYDFDERCEGGRALLGGKGLGLAEMTQLGLPVPFGFTVTTEACRVATERGRVAARRPGRDPRPRSPSRGADREAVRQRDEPAPALGALGRPGLDAGHDGDSSEPRHEPCDRSRRRPSRPGTSGSRSTPIAACCRCTASVVADIDGARFEQAIDRLKHDRGIELDSQLTASDFIELAGWFEEIFREETGSGVPDRSARAARLRGQGRLRVVGRSASARLPARVPHSGRPRNRRERDGDGVREPRRALRDGRLLQPKPRDG